MRKFVYLLTTTTFTPIHIFISTPYLIVLSVLLILSALSFSNFSLLRFSTEDIDGAGDQCHPFDLLFVCFELNFEFFLKSPILFTSVNLILSYREYKIVMCRESARQITNWYAFIKFTNCKNTNQSIVVAKRIVKCCFSVLQLLFVFEFRPYSPYIYYIQCITHNMNR